MDNIRPTELLSTVLDVLRTYGVAVEWLPAAYPLAGAPSADAVLQLNGQRYEVHTKRAVTPSSLGAVAHQVHSVQAPVLLVSDYITPPVADALRALGLAFVDAAGNAYVQQPGLLVWVKGQKPQHMASAKAPTGRAFQASGLSVLFTLLCNPAWLNLPYRDIAQRAGVAHGTVGWVMAELQALGHMGEVHGRRAWVHRERVLKLWAEFYPRVLRPKLLLGRYQAESLNWWNELDPAAYGAVLGGEPAGGRLTGYLRPGTATFYADKINPRLLLDLRLRQDEAGNVQIYKRFWHFDVRSPHAAPTTDAPVPDPPPQLAPALLVYADLMASGEGRSMETARLVYDQLLAPDTP
ncbi:MAG: type IV toxin-antitoxin system AbiEi family antitoxin [Hydrogenophaga sp.]|nr:type IV toxin-antitoxin system AbiEi family antitoxin [Hydrogenophaga sp.]